MNLIANKPCSFSGQKFYIGDEIPADLVADAKMQEKLGVIAIVNTEGAPCGESGVFSTPGQYKQDMAELQEYRDLGVTPEQIRKIDESYAELAQALAQAKKELSAGIVISVRGWNYSETGVATDISATPEQINRVFGILQCTAEGGAKTVADITDETVLLLIHAADSRRTVKNAAKEQAGKLSSTQGETNEATGDNATTDTYTEGS